MDLPKELHTIIVSYLDDFRDVDNYQSVYNTIEWNELIRLRYPEFHTLNLNKYNNKYIYYDLIMHKCKNWEIYIPVFTETAEYLFINGLMSPLKISLEQISKYDSIEIFKLNQKYVDSLFKYYIANDYHKLIEYILNNKLLNSKDLFNSLVSVQLKRVNWDIINLILKFINNIELDNDNFNMLFMRSSNELAIHLISILEELRNVELIYYLPKWINLCQDVDLKFFIKFWEKYSPFLSQVDIQEILSKLDKSKNLAVVNYLEILSEYQ